MRFIQNWVQDTARGRPVPQMDTIQSEWPTYEGASGLCSGFRQPTSESCSILISVSAGYWFKPRMLWVTNNNTAMNQIVLYTVGSATDASATIGGIWMQPRETQFIALDGITAAADIWVSCLIASAEVRIAGVAVQSIA